MNEWTSTIGRYGHVEDAKEFNTVGELITYLLTFHTSTKICYGAGGGSIYVAEEINDNGETVLNF